MKTPYIIAAIIAASISIFFANLTEYEAPAGSGAACGFAIAAGLCVLASAIKKDID
jgi:hypothetical protein